jgi:hypothetical protein
MSFMAKRRLTYGDAVKLLGGQSKWASLLGKAAGAGLASVPIVGPALTFLDLRDDVEQAGQSAIAALRGRLTGLSRFKRSELLEAAHAVLVINAFFTALDDLDEELRTALNSASLELTRLEQAAIAGDREWELLRSGGEGLAGIAFTLSRPGRIPGLDAVVADSGPELESFYRVMAADLLSFAQGTAVWDERDETTRDRWIAAITTGHLASSAVARYEQTLAQLAGDFPELAFWAHRVGVRAILDGLAELSQTTRTTRTTTELLAAAARGTTPSMVRADLRARYQDQLARPIADAAETVSGAVALPSLRELYVNPSCRRLPPARRAADIEWITEPGWQDGRQAGLWETVTEHLISTDAIHVPVVLFGQPGAGKSVFTQMLAAELDPRDFLVVRVELRAVPSDAGIQRQIEAALADLTGRAITWPDLAGDAGDAQLVIVLDGFDELLQASGQSQFDFLERVQEFQDREESLDRPVVVLVTSRTAVANQVRYPEGTVTVRLEEFDDDRVSDWLAAWNRANPGRPLPVETALEQGELARQPLLLFMLALFHSGGGDLTPGLRRAELYQRLFTEFVERDVNKLGTRGSGEERARRVRRDLDQLSLVAFAMFNRGRESIAEDELTADLSSLDRGASPAANRAAALTVASQLAGRFFFRLFMQRDQAMHGQRAAVSSYEFLHASFGEFLVARWVVAELRRIGEQDHRSADDLYRRPPDDDLFHALLSREVLSTREQRVLDFAAELLTGAEGEELARLHTLLVRLFHDCLQPRAASPYLGYQPTSQNVPAAYAAYSANLLLLLLAVAEAQGPAAGNVQLRDFRSYSRLWHAQLSVYQWDSLLDVIHVLSPITEQPSDDGGLRLARWTARELIMPVCEQLFLPEPGAWIVPASPAGRAAREAKLLANAGYIVALTTLLPYFRTVSGGFEEGGLQLGFQAAKLLQLLVSPSWELPAAERADLYRSLSIRLFTVRQSRLLLEQLRVDIHRLHARDLAELTVAAVPAAWTHITAYLDVLAHVHAAQPDGGYRPLPVHDLLSALREGRGRLPVELRALLEEVGGREWSHPAGGVFIDARESVDLIRLLDWDADRFPLVFSDADPLRIVGSLELMVPPGSAGLHVRSMFDQIPDWEPLFDIALWTGMAERGLPVDRAYQPLTPREAAVCYDIIPGFVVRARRLALGLGYPDPFPLGSGA